MRYAGKPAVLDVSLRVPSKQITALHRPLGLRQVDDPALLRPHERPDPGGAGRRARCSTTGSTSTARASTRSRSASAIGMVFQKPNPFPKSIYDNIAFGPKVLGIKGDMDEMRRERAAPRLAVGRRQGPPQGQRVRDVRRPAAAPLHRPRAADEPRRAADGRAVLGARPDLHGAHRGSDARAQGEVSIVIVTHNMQQAARVSDRTAFFIVDLSAGEDQRIGRLVEYGPTQRIFTRRTTSAQRTTSPGSSADR